MLKMYRIIGGAGPAVAGGTMDEDDVMLDTLALADRRELSFPGGSVYLCVVAYVLGFWRGVPRVEDQFQKYVTTRSGSVALSWPRSLLMAASFSFEEIAQLMSVRADDELNRRAIGALFQILREYQEVRQRGALAELLNRDDAPG